MKNRMKWREMSYIGLKLDKRQIESPFRDTDDYDDAILTNPSDLDSDEFIGLLVGSLIDKCTI